MSSSVERKIGVKMSKMAELSMQIDDLVERGMSAKFISYSLNIPFEWAQNAIEERMQLEQEKQYEMMQNSEEYND
jgi:hypothetical protein